MSCHREIVIVLSSCQEHSNISRWCLFVGSGKIPIELHRYTVSHFQPLPPFYIFLLSKVDAFDCLLRITVEPILWCRIDCTVPTEIQVVGMSSLFVHFVLQEKLDFIQIFAICRSSQSFCRSACCRSLPLHFPLLAGVNLASNSHRSSFQTGSSSQQNAETHQKIAESWSIQSDT